MKTQDFIQKTEKKIENSTPVVENAIPDEPVPFAREHAEDLYQQLLSEEATAGATGVGSVSAVVSPLGAGPTDVIRRQKRYTNQISKGGSVKVRR